MIVAIDGPAGSGKSTLAKVLAEELKFYYLDSGALYRTLTLFALSKLLGAPSYAWENTDIGDELRKKTGGISKDDITKFLATDDYQNGIKDLPMRLEFMDGAQTMFIGDENVSETIRLPEVTRNIGPIANFGPSRDVVNTVLRSFAGENDVLIDGRDIGTEVFPNADIKFYLDASVDVRAQRRLLDLEAQGIKTDLAELTAEIARRDESDMSRELAPLRKADDAILIDTSSLSKNDVFQLLLDKINHAGSA